MKKTVILLFALIIAFPTFASFPVEVQLLASQTTISTVTDENNATVTDENIATVTDENNALSNLMEFIPAPIEDTTIIAALLCLMFGSFGIHWFYLGDKSKGIKRLSVFGLGVAAYVLGYASIFATGAVGLAYVLFLAGYAIFIVNWIMTLMDLVKILTGKV